METGDVLVGDDDGCVVISASAAMAPTKNNTAIMSLLRTILLIITVLILLLIMIIIQVVIVIVIIVLVLVLVLGAGGGRAGAGAAAAGGADPPDRGGGISARLRLFSSSSFLRMRSQGEKCP